MYDEILYDVDDPVAVITLNRPAALNAWTNTMDDEIRDAFRRAEADAAVVGIVVTGAGRAFCAGADMNLLSDLTDGGDGEHSLGRAAADWPLWRSARYWRSRPRRSPDHRYSPASADRWGAPSRPERRASSAGFIALPGK